jgi:hypothetical protein
VEFSNRAETAPVDAGKLGDRLPIACAMTSAQFARIGVRRNALNMMTELTDRRDLVLDGAEVIEAICDGT